MIDKKCLRIMRSPCKKDYKGEHLWERRGLVNFDSIPAICTIWQCTQCDLCAEENLEFLPEDASDGEGVA